MRNLYRIVKADAWKEAKEIGYIPRCGNDKKLDRIHLNVHEAVEFVAAKYYTPDEQPLAIEFDVSSFSESIEWLEPTDELPWKQPLVDIPNLPIHAVVAIHQLDPVLVDGKNTYKLRKAVKDTAP